MTQKKKSPKPRPQATRGKRPAQGREKSPVAAPPARKRSALEAAAEVLHGASEPLSAKELIAAMAAQQLWVSPGGRTPHATLYAALIREIQQKGEAARFQKVDRGRFSARNP